MILSDNETSVPNKQSKNAVVISPLLSLIQNNINWQFTHSS